MGRNVWNFLWANYILHFGVQKEVPVIDRLIKKFDFVSLHVFASQVHVFSLELFWLGLKNNSVTRCVFRTLGHFFVNILR